MLSATRARIKDAPEEAKSGRIGVPSFQRALQNGCRLISPGDTEVGMERPLPALADACVCTGWCIQAEAQPGSRRGDSNSLLILYVHST